MTTLDKVLSCPNLPSLPAVAVEVLALISSSEVSLIAISRVIQNDPALAAKILKTVNSSFYGLQQPCPSVDRAMSYLGLQSVKALVLGFSLIDATRGLGSDRTVDLRTHWRRIIYAASAARHLAIATRAVDPDEAFTASLFQDIGILACVAALGQDYTATLSTAPAAHAQLARHERETFPFDHTTVGAEMAKRWKLPAVYIEAIRHHHTPDASGLSFPHIVQTTALSVMVAEVMSLPGATATLAQLTEKANVWFSLSPEALAPILNATDTSARELAKLFEQDVAIPDAGAIMAEAHEQLIHGHLQMQRESDRLKQESTTDTLTSLSNRRHFDQLSAESFEAAKRERRSLGVLFVDIDHFKSVNDTHGHSAGDAALAHVASCMKRAIAENGQAFRFGGEEFCVLLPGLDGVRVREVAEQIRRAIEDRPASLAHIDGAPATLPLTASVGCATMKAGSGTTYDSFAALLSAADQAVYAAKTAGRNCVRFAGSPSKPTSKPAPAESSTTAPKPPAPSPDPAQTRSRARPLHSAKIIIIEDDPLAGKLLSMLLKRQVDASIQWVTCAADALALKIRTPEEQPLVALVDLQLPDMPGHELIGRLRSTYPTIAHIAVISAHDNTTSQAACMQGGANSFVSKFDLMNNVVGNLRILLGPLAVAETTGTHAAAPAADAA
ncbi:HDOD domain-containing protein [Nodularia spumigena]|uniref:HDOD domain-containing protein n=1 Tax=Nodularia spumigena TaxID=70799 RepID=UPI002B1F5748|nr:HDOD domain-containing protein [Nodularia spumigena]MEA5557589.1 HDOD domain-containing protein [Nodularia spumigena CH309]